MLDFHNKGADFKRDLMADVQDHVARMVSSISATFAAQKDGAVVSDQHRVLNFQGPGVSVTDDPSARRTNIFIGGAPSTGSSLTVNSASGSGKMLAVTVGGTPPANWSTVAFDDSAWAASVLQTSTLIRTPFGSTQWVAQIAGDQVDGQQFVHRRTFTIPALSTPTGGTLLIWADNYLMEVRLNGTLISSPGTSIDWEGGNSTPALSISIDSATLLAGTNVLAVWVRNAPSGGTHPNPLSVDYQLSINYSSPTGGVTTLLLDVAESTDIASGLAASANTWTQIGNTQTFTVTNSASIIEVAITGQILYNGASGVHGGSRINIDSGSIVRVIGGCSGIGSFNNVLAGSDVATITGLTAAAHTVKVEVYPDGGGATIFCRCSTKPNTETLRYRVLQAA